jgi:trans-aconitate 2-methyltransferase
MDWSAKQYTKFERERTRPALDLLNAVETRATKRAVDLGCGPGNSTELLAARYPDAEIVGVDTSADMLEAARQRLPTARFEQGDIAVWDGGGSWDVIFANAAFQWVPSHETLLPRLLGKLAPGGSLAVQMPDNLNEPSHVLMRDVASKPEFRSKLAKAAEARTTLNGAAWYYEVLRPSARSIDLWRTTYFHVLDGGIDAIVEWLKGTGLMPFLKPLDEEERAAFLAAYRSALADAYAVNADGSVILPFPRFFFVATR